MYLGIDIGASYCKVALIDSDKNMISCKRVKMPPFVISESPLIYEVDVRKIINMTIALMKDITEESKHTVEAIGVAGQMHGIVVLDKSKLPLSNFISWQDQRTTEVMHNKRFSFIDFLREEISSYRLITGTDLRSGMLGPLLFWLKTNGYVTHKVSFLSDYLVSVLTGSNIVCDPTQASGSGVYNLLDNTWLDEFIRVAGITEEILPQIVESGTKVGGVRDSAFCIKQGTPVYVSVGDYHAALFASEIHTRNLSINIGTGAQISVLTRTPRYSEYFETRPFFDGYYTNCVSGLPGGRGLTFEDFTNKKLLRDIVKKYYEAFEILTIKGHYRGLDIVLSGGVAQGNELLREIIRDVFDSEVVLAKHKEEAAVGAALLAMKYNCSDRG